MKGTSENAGGSAEKSPQASIVRLKETAIVGRKTTNIADDNKKTGEKGAGRSQKEKMKTS